ncbi:hypothetical protein HNY73_008543 [Argiope bruennichi]|uniref:Zinc finger PHD-type domain-containing protein n=1 Tax=Argiope bruennichi TaxID=94029 RepID=A0A8T0F6W1_ARGBR|nr:hypothetical protein HNY73_008543 [Argiope bruennichi]
MMKKSFIITDEQTVVKRSRLPEKKKLDGKTKSTTSLKCPCKCKLAEENDLISCTNCKQLQHKTCYGILDSFGNQPNFYCVDCSTYGDYPLTDLIYIYVGKECQLETNSILPPTSHLISQQGMLSKSVDVIENSIRKVKKLNLRDISPAKSSASRKRKVSSETVNLDDSEELFQSQKRLRVRKATKQYKS